MEKHITRCMEKHITRCAHGTGYLSGICNSSNVGKHKQSANVHSEGKIQSCERADIESEQHLSRYIDSQVVLGVANVHVDAVLL